MEPKKTPSKTALFILVNLMFCIEFAQGFFDTELLKAHFVAYPEDYSEMTEVNEKMNELGYGTCSREILNQLRGADCRLNLDKNNSNMKQLMHENITCSDVDRAVQCAVPLSFKECYTAQELIRSRDLFLEYLYVIIKYHDGNLAKFETCKNEILSYGTESPPPETKNKAGYIVGTNMGLLIVLFFIVTPYFGI